MKKIVVFSDVHYGSGNLLRMLEDNKDADYYFFLGDGLDNVLHYVDDDVREKLRYVEGNCDTMYQHDDIEVVEGKKFLLTHGNKYHVKSDMLALTYKAEELEVDVALFGHTHRPYSDKMGGRYYVNPGALGPHGQYAIIIVENGEIFVIPSKVV